MIRIKTFVIKIVVFVIVLLFCMTCSKSKEQNAFFKETYVEVLSNEIFKFRNIRPPSPEEFKNGIKGPLPSFRDTLNPLELYVQKEPEKVSFNKFNIKLPKEYKFACDSICTTIDYLPKNIGEYSTEKYRFIGFTDLDHVSKIDKLSLTNFGGILQFSKVLVNEGNDRALLFVRDTRDALDSIESLVFFEKIDGKWKVLKSIVISFA